MAKPRKQERVFHSMEDIDREYFPQLSRIVRQSRESDPEILGRILARSTLAEVKALLGEQQVSGE